MMPRGSTSIVCTRRVPPDDVGVALMLSPGLNAGNDGDDFDDDASALDDDDAPDDNDFGDGDPAVGDCDDDFDDFADCCADCDPGPSGMRSTVDRRERSGPSEYSR